jgi:hypothetical protein
MFDVVGKLSKKDKKKKGKKAKANDLEWSEPMTPAAELEPEMSLGSKEVVKEEEATPVDLDVASRKLSKKDKKKAKNSSFSWDEPSETVTPSTPTETLDEVLELPQVAETTGESQITEQDSSSVDMQGSGTVQNVSAGKLGKKGKKKAKNQTFAWDEPSEPSTPVAEAQDPITVSSAELELPVAQTDMKDLQQEDDSGFSAPNRKLSKKDKKKAAKAAAFDWTEPQVPSSGTTPLEPEQPAQDPKEAGFVREDEPVQVSEFRDPEQEETHFPSPSEVPANDESISTSIVEPPLEQPMEGSSITEQFHMLDQPSAMEHPETLQSQHTEQPTIEQLRSEGDHPQQDAPILGESSIPIADPSTFESAESTGGIETQEPIVGEPPVLSRKLSKKDKKKAKKTPTWEEPSAEINEDTSFPESRLQENLKSALPTPQDVVEEERPALSRKLSKKEKKKGKQAAFWDEPVEELGEAVQSTQEQAVTQEDIVPAPLVSSDDVAVHQDDLSSTQATKPVESQDDFSTFAPSRKASKKEKKKKGKASAFAWDEPEKSLEQAEAPTTVESAILMETGQLESEPVEKPKDIVIEASSTLEQLDEPSIQPTSDVREEAPIITEAVESQLEQGPEHLHLEPSPVVQDHTSTDLQIEEHQSDFHVEPQPHDLALQSSAEVHSEDPHFAATSDSHVEPEPIFTESRDIPPQQEPASTEDPMSNEQAPSTAPENIVEEPAFIPTLGRKQSKKDKKKKGKSTVFDWDEPAPASEEPATVSRIMPGAEEASFDDFATPSSKKNKKKKGKAAVVDWNEAEPEPVSEEAATVLEAMPVAQDAPFDDFATPSSKKDKKKKSKKAVFNLPSAEPEVAQVSESAMVSDREAEQEQPIAENRDIEHVSQPTNPEGEPTTLSEQNLDDAQALEPVLAPLEPVSQAEEPIPRDLPTAQPEVEPVVESEPQFEFSSKKSKKQKHKSKPTETFFDEPAPDVSSSTLESQDPVNLPEDVPTQPIAEPEDEWALPSKKSKKEKRKTKVAATTSFNEPESDVQMSLPANEPKELVLPEVPVFEGAVASLDEPKEFVLPETPLFQEAVASPADEQNFSFTQKKSKKEKRKSKQVDISQDEPIQMVEETNPTDTVPTPVMAEPVAFESTEGRDISVSESSKLVQTSPPEVPQPALEESVEVQPKSTKKKVKKHKFAALFEPDTSTGPVVPIKPTRAVSPKPPPYAIVAGQTTTPSISSERDDHKTDEMEGVMADLQDQSVDLPPTVATEQEVVPSNFTSQLLPEAEQIERDGHMEQSFSEAREEPSIAPRSSSPKQDIDFAAAIAAGLQESGFDSNMVINDPTFHRSTSPEGAPDISTLDDVAEAREEANRSKFGNLGRISPSSTSPKPQPVPDIDRDIFPAESAPLDRTMEHEENRAEVVAPSFNPTDVLSDPMFSQRKTSPGVLEEADPEELWSSSKSKKGKKGKKKRGSGLVTPVETERTLESVGLDPTQPLDEQEPLAPSTPFETLPAETQASSDPIDNIQDETTQATPVNIEPEDLWADSTSKKKGKKAKKDKKRTSLAQDNVESVTVEAPVIEAPTAVPFAVETPADMTTKDVEREEPLLSTTAEHDNTILPVEDSPREPAGEKPSLDVDKDLSLELAESQSRASEIPATIDDVRDEQPKKKGKKGKGKLKRTSTVEQPVEVESPAIIDTAQVELVERSQELEKDLPGLEQNEEMEDWTSSKKKGKKLKKNKKGGSEGLVAVGAAAVATSLLEKDREGGDGEVQDRGDVEAAVPLPPTFDEEPKSLGGAEPEEYPFPKLSQPVELDVVSRNVITASDEGNPDMVGEQGVLSEVKEIMGERGLETMENTETNKQFATYPPAAMGERAVQEEDLRGLGIEAVPHDYHTTKDNVQATDIHVAQAMVPDLQGDAHTSSLASSARSLDIGEKASPPGKLAALPRGVERVKRRDPPVTTPDVRPEEKRMHLEGPLPEMSTIHHESDFVPPTHVPEIRTERSHPIQESMPSVPHEPAVSRGHSPVFEPTWSFGGVRDSAVHVADSPLLSTAPPVQANIRDSGYHDTPSIPQGPSEPFEGSQPKKKKRQSEEVEQHSIADIERDDHMEAQRRERSPSLPDAPSFIGISSPSAIDSATKERTSYLFNSSPSTRAYDTPAASANPRQHEIESLGSNKEQSREKSESHSRSHKHLEASPPHAPTSRTTEHGSPTRQRKEPYKSIFGDPTEKSSESPSLLTTPSTKHMRTPSSQLGTIKEFSSPDDSPLHKKGRAISDVGAPDRGVKAPRRSTSPKPFSERLKSPPPQTPTPSKRRNAGPTIDTSALDTPSKDSPWHQVHEGIDRSIALSPARRLRSPPASDPTKQRLGEQRSPSVMSDRSIGSITRHKTPDHLRPLSATSNRSATPPLRRVDRSASGDLRAASRLGGVKARDAKSSQPDLASIALAAGATAAIVGIASSSKYDPVNDKGKGRADMPDVYVSFPA